VGCEVRARGECHASSPPPYHRCKGVSAEPKVGSMVWLECMAGTGIVGGGATTKFRPDSSGLDELREQDHTYQIHPATFPAGGGGLYWIYWMRAGCRTHHP